MSRPVPTQIVHFTRVENLTTILARGLLSDTLAQAAGVLGVEVGNVGIKARRAERKVHVTPGGVVADYAPFYFAPRSPMMYSIHMGNVPTYQDGCGRLIYLVTTLERLQQLGLSVVLSDRNAVLHLTEFWPLAKGEPAADFVDWPVMRERIWRATEDDPDRVERRMAECLVHERVPAQAFTGIVAMNRSVADEAKSLVHDSGLTIPVSVVRDWYF